MLIALSTDKAQRPLISDRKRQRQSVYFKSSNLLEVQAKLNQVNVSLENCLIDCDFSPKSVKLRVESVLQSLWSDGVLYGASASQAYVTLQDPDNHLNVFCVILGHKFVIKVRHDSEATSLDSYSLEV